MNVSECKIKSAIVMSIREAVEVTRLFGLDADQAIEFDIKQFDKKRSINMIRCCLEFPSEADEMIELQRFVFIRHCILMDIHEQLEFVVHWKQRRGRPFN